MRKVTIMYSIESLKIIIAERILKLANEIENTEKASLQITLLRNMQNTINSPTASAYNFVKVLNCLAEGGDLPYKVLVNLFKLLNQASCGHFAVIAALNFCGKKIDFPLLIDLMTRGDFHKNRNLLSSNKNHFLDIIPAYEQKPIIDFGDIIINNTVFIEQTCPLSNGVYLFKGFDVIEEESHRFMLIKHDKYSFFVDNNKEGLHNNKSENNKSFPNLNKYTNVEGHFVSILTNSIKLKLNKRISAYLLTAFPISIYSDSNILNEKKSKNIINIPDKKKLNCIIL